MQFYEVIQIFQTYFYHLNTPLLTIDSQTSKFLIYYKHIQFDSTLSWNMVSPSKREHENSGKYT